MKRAAAIRPGWCCDPIARRSHSGEPPDEHANASFSTVLSDQEIDTVAPKE